MRGSKWRSCSGLIWGRLFQAAAESERRDGPGAVVGSVAARALFNYWQAADDRIWMLLAYPKSEQEDLSRDQLRRLKVLVEEYLL
jgi:hypothetical protein